MIEKAYTFGEESNLVGILSEPTQKNTGKSPIVIFLNAGLLHHVGPYRLHVDMARELASSGYSSFRFDIGGIGDSNTKKGSLPIHERAVQETRDAISFLSGIKDTNQFILFGLCTGADSGHRTAVEDNKVIGTILLDGYIYKTPKYYVKKYIPKLISVEKWMALAKRIITRLILSNRRKNVENDVKEDMFFWILPAKNKAVKEQNILVKRKVRQLCVFSGGYQDYIYHGQFHDAFRSINFGSLLQEVHFPEADHTYTLVKDRKLLIQTAVDWVKNNFDK